MPERLVSYRRDLGGDRIDWLRVRFTIDAGRVVRFAIQYETVIDERARPVVRYDTAHGRPHRDLLDRRGRVIEKTWLDLTHEAALTSAIDDVDAHWPAYKATFLEMVP